MSQKFQCPSLSISHNLETIALIPVIFSAVGRAGGSYILNVLSAMTFSTLNLQSSKIQSSSLFSLKQTPASSNFFYANHQEIFQKSPFWKHSKPKINSLSIKAYHFWKYQVDGRCIELLFETVTLSKVTVHHPFFFFRLPALMNLCLSQDQVKILS